VENDQSIQNRNFGVQMRKKKNQEIKQILRNSKVLTVDIEIKRSRLWVSYTIVPSLGLKPKTKDKK